jgi:hypothetical protein
VSWGIDPNGKIGFWLWDVSEMTVGAFRMCHLFAKRGLLDVVIAKRKMGPAQRGRVI